MIALTCLLGLSLVQISLDRILPEESSQDWGSLNFGRSVQDHPMKIGGRSFIGGLGTHARSRVVYDLEGKSERFQSWVGIDDEMDFRPMASVVFRVVGDGKELYRSEICRAKEPARRVDVSVAGIRKLELIVDDAGDGVDSDHADWAEAVLLGRPKQSKGSSQPIWKVSGKSLTVSIDAQGRIARIEVPNSHFSRVSQSRTRIGDLGDVSRPIVGRRHGTVICTRKLQRGITLRETFAPHGTGVRWTLSVSDNNPSWSAPIVSEIKIEPRPNDRYWTAWGGGEIWSDPLEPKPLSVALREYGAYFARLGGVSLPIHTLIGNVGVSMLQALDDRVYSMSLGTDPQGTYRFARTHLRLGQGRVWDFHIDLIPHAPDSRSALAAVVATKPSWFEPPNHHTNEIAGHGAYTGYEKPLDKAKFHQMAYSVNWKASIDFPYMGMFIPPIAKEVRWNRFAGGGGGVYTANDEGRFGSTSIAQLDGYAGQMESEGFHVLNYFNVTEFGGNILPFDQKLVSSSDKPLWNDPNAFLRRTFPNAPVKVPGTIWTWGGAVVTDCGDPPYRDFLLNQAKRLFTDVPNAVGICIDRLDWLELYNKGGNDGLTWDNGPCRSLMNSWRNLMAKLGPLAHHRDKLIYANFMVRRPDIAAQLDGVYDEFGDVPYDLNCSTWCLLNKPLICWTRDKQQVLEGGDDFFQRYLYMGAFMTTPMPENDHTVLPDPAVDRLYLDYGPLFAALKGRRWVLAPNPVSVQGTGKANIFDTPNGKVVVIAFAGKKRETAVTIRTNQNMQAEAITPGSTRWTPVRSVRHGGSMTMTVPLSRGAAAVRLNSRLSR